MMIRIIIVMSLSGCGYPYEDKDIVMSLSGCGDL